ncbi:MAG TPA: class A beta-lactamase [Pyrinomonadaceae bacterium]|nr:class A beta-lactamase [Pyrinomonadaceae bacterium]
MRQYLLLITALFALGCQSNNQPVTSAPSSASPNGSQTSSPTGDQLATNLKAIIDRAGGNSAATVIHVETGRITSINGSAKLPLYSVFKLPLAVAVLKDVEEKRLQIDQQVHVTPSDIVQGAPSNTAMWREPVDRTVAQLIDVSIALSDNTSTDKLLHLAGGPEAVTRRLRALGFNEIEIQTTIRDFAATLKNHNTGSSNDLAKLLMRVQKGELLQPAQQELLIGFMRGATTGTRRIRGNLPAGTIVGDKTGSGETNKTTGTPNATNDVGLITLPDGSHLAIAVLISGSKLYDVEQEKVIADVGRAAYDAFAK